LTIALLDQIYERTLSLACRLADLLQCQRRLPGDPRYEIFTPLFDKVTFNLDRKYPKGKSFTVLARNNSSQNVYIQSAKLNDKQLERCWLRYLEITSGGVLNLTLGPQPNNQWGIEAQ